MSKENGGPGPLDLLYAQHDRPLEDSKAVLEKSVLRKKQAMSRATELAVKCGAQESRYLVVGAGPDLYALRMTPGQLEAFYHAARAEALREAADFCAIEGSLYAGSDCGDALRAMADREGK